MSVRDVMNSTKVIPVLAFRSVEEALEVSRALVEGGISVLEITLRHPSALEAIRAVSAALPNANVGAGTVMSPTLAEQARAAGARFGVSPGLTPRLAEAVQAMGWPFLPGVSTVSEAMSAVELGFDALKFFPAAASGGAPFLASVGAVLPDVQFCPTGGVKPGNAADYLALDNVPCVGGSWLTQRETDGRIDSAAVIERTRRAAQL